MTMITVAFVLCHAGPAGQAADFVKTLDSNYFTCEVHASGPAKEKFGSAKILEFDENDPDAVEKVAQACQNASIVISDLGAAFPEKLQNRLKEISSVHRFALYDNQEPFVAGGYSRHAAKVIEAVDGVLFSNANLATTGIYDDEQQKVDLEGKELFPIGYDTLQEGEVWEKRRKEEKGKMREEVFSQLEIEDTGQKLLFYLGGNNEVYYGRDFPALVQVARELDDSVLILVQQHPGARAENQDLGSLVEEDKNRILASPFSSTVEGLIAADAVLYAQSSMAPKIAYAQIPMIQVGEEPFEDAVYRTRGCASVSTGADLLNAVANPTYSSKEQLKAEVGVFDDWQIRINQALLSVSESTIE